MAKRIVYSEPDDYFPVSLREKYKLGEFTETEKKTAKKKATKKATEKISLERSSYQVKPHETTIVQYRRDPYISQYAKSRANGKCQLCEKDAPFTDSNGQPYLESHHLIWLSNGGEDSIYNVVALCPNCHKKMHIVNNQTDINFLFKKIK